MGRYLALGVATTIDVYKKKRAPLDFSITQNKDKIKKQLEKFLDLEKYDCCENDDCFTFRIKTDIFNDNVHDLIKELYPMIDCYYDLCGDDYYCGNDDEKDKIRKNFNAENYPLTLTICGEGYRKGRFCSSWNDGCEDGSFPAAPEYWLFEDKEFRNNIDVNISYITIWFDCNKFDSEDETPLLEIMNNMSRKYYKSPLSRTMFFYISG